MGHHLLDNNQASSLVIFFSEAGYLPLAGSANKVLGTHLHEVYKLLIQ